MSDFGFSQLPNSRWEEGGKPEKQSFGAILSLAFSFKKTHNNTTQNKLNK